MEKASNYVDRLQDLLLTDVKPNGNNIGTGAYGRVFEVEFCGTVYAAKEIHAALVQGVRREEFEATKTAFVIECVRSSSLAHPNIVLFLGVYNPGGQSLLPVLVMERMQESLTSVVEKYPNIPIHVKLSMLLDVSRGLWYLHAHHPPIVHRDLSPNNVLLTSQFVAKISDLGVAKAIKADSKKTKTRAPGTIDFMPPEALQEIPEYSLPLDIFSYGGVILHVMNQEWPKPLHYVMTDPKTGKVLGLTEVERRQQHVEKITGTPADLQSLVVQCLDNQPSRRPPISDVSERMKQMKQAESARCIHINMDPTTWPQVEQTTKMLGETAITVPTAKVQQPVADAQKDIFSKAVNWKELSPLPVNRSACYAVLLDGVIYVGSGYEKHALSKQVKLCNRLDMYDVTADQWSSPITTPYCLFAMTAVDNKLVTAGGMHITNFEVVKKVLVLNAGQWKDLSEMPTARCHSTAAGHNSMLILVGGQAFVNGQVTTVATTELLDTTNGCWYPCDNLPSPHYQLKAAIMNNTLYMLGGFQDDKPTPHIFVASLNTVSDHQLIWQSRQNASFHLSIPVVPYDKVLLAVGGTEKSNINNISDMVYILNTSTGMWEYLTNMPAKRSGPAVVSIASKIIVIGGVSGGSNLCNSVWRATFE